MQVLQDVKKVKTDPNRANSFFCSQIVISVFCLMVVALGAVVVIVVVFARLVMVLLVVASLMVGETVLVSV